VIVGARALAGDDHYDVLGVDASASLTEIRVSYLALVRKWHPDVAPAELRAEAEEATKRLNAAYFTLSDPALRARYDIESSFDPDEALRLARDRAQRETAEYRRRQSAWQRLYDDFRVAQAQERAREPERGNAGFQLPRVGMIITVVTPSGSFDDLEDQWAAEARDEGLTLRPSAPVHRGPVRTRAKVWVEGERGAVKRFLDRLANRLHDQAAAAGGRRNSKLTYSDFPRL
jgi:curved DNA-binding protein CbpA